MAERGGAGDLGARRLAGAADRRNDHCAVAPPQIVVTDADRHHAFLFPLLADARFDLRAFRQGRNI